LAHIVLDEDRAPTPQKGHTPPQFSAHVRCCQTAGWIKMLLGVEVGLSPGHIVLDGDPPLKGHDPMPPQFSARVCGGKTAGWIKMPLGREVDIGPGDIVLNGVKLPLPRPERGPA